MRRSVLLMLVLHNPPDAAVTLGVTRRTATAAAAIHDKNFYLISKSLGA